MMACMLKIRLQRVGRVHMPVFRVVLTDSSNSTKSGKSIEMLGTWNNTTHERKVDAERVKYWLSKGAQPSVTIHNFLISQKIIEGKKLNALPKHRPIAKTPDVDRPQTSGVVAEPVKTEEKSVEVAPVA